jgi:hypothetical protein
MQKIILRKIVNSNLPFALALVVVEGLAKAFETFFSFPPPGECLQVVIQGKNKSLNLCTRNYVSLVEELLVCFIYSPGGHIM